VSFGAWRQVVVRIGCDPEVPARVAVAMVGALEGGIEILWLLVSGTCCRSGSTDLVGDAFVKDEERIERIRHICCVGWGDGCDLGV
jgi:hypothetical protein